MQFCLIEGFYSASRITGPRHNLLQVQFSDSPIERPICECLPPIGGCVHEPLDEHGLIDAVLAGAAQANSQFGTRYFISHIKYVKNDTGPETVYGALVQKIIERLALGEEFAAGISKRTAT